MHDTAWLPSVLAFALAATCAVFAGGCLERSGECDADSDCFKNEVCQKSGATGSCVPKHGDAASDAEPQDTQGATDVDAAPPGRDSRTRDGTGRDSTEPGDTDGDAEPDAGDTGTRRDVDTSVPDGCTPEPETCNGADDDCDGTVDEDVTMSCPKSEGVCAGVSAACNDGSFESCSDAYGPDYESDESTPDGLDNDCDGKTDEVFESLDFYSDELACGRTVADDVYCWGRVVNQNNLSFPKSGTYTQLGVGSQHVCAIDSSDTISCWGTGGLGTLQPPSGSYSFLAAGSQKSCAIDKATGYVDCWGVTSGSRSDQSFVRLDVGSDYCGVRTDRYVDCWGSSLSESIDDGVPSRTRFSRVVIRDPHACGIRKTDGTIRCWGQGTPPEPSGSFLELDIGAPVDGNGDTRLYGCAVSTSAGNAAGGPIDCWGYTTSATGTPPNSGTFTDVKVTNNGGCALRNDHVVECWGTGPTPQ